MRVLRNISLILFTTLLLTGCGARNTRKAIEKELENSNEQVHSHHHNTNQTLQGIIISAERFASGNAVDTVYMGRVSAGEVVSRKIRLRNAADTPLLLVSSRTTCGCVAVDYSTEPIRAKGNTTIEVRFDSAGYGGGFSQSLYLQTSISEEPHKLVVTANVR